MTNDYPRLGPVDVSRFFRAEMDELNPELRNEVAAMTVRLTELAEEVDDEGAASRFQWASRMIEDGWTQLHDPEYNGWRVKE